MRVAGVGNTPTFARKPNAKEMVVYTESLNKGLSILGKQMDIILHNSSAPAVRAENTGIGSLFSRTVRDKLIPFLKEHSFSHIQQEPNGLRRAYDNSPYAPEADTKNIFMIPLEKLASDEYGNILSKESFNKIVDNIPSPDRVDYPYVRKNYDMALREAFDNAKKSETWSREFEKFKSENESKYEQNAIYRILSQENNNASWEDWNKVDDKTLYLHPETSKARIAELKDKYRDDYDFYLFEQMILERENRISNDFTKESGISIIGDSPVASSAVEEWVNQDLFLKDMALGCPPDEFAPEGQRWDFKYYNPKNIFNKDGSLGKAGKILKQKYENYFASFPGGIRIDHTIGLIDPFLYNVNSKKMTRRNSGRIYSKPKSEFRKHSEEEYAAILSKIVLPAAEKYGIDKSMIICEDLGVVTKPVEKVMKKLGLGGISVTQFNMRGSSVARDNTIMLGSHDNQSFLEYTDDLFKNASLSDFFQKTEFLAEDTLPKGATKAKRDKYLSKIRSDKKEFIAASFAELFASPAKRVQIFFTDLFGIAKTYNKPGTNEGNWEVRLGGDFEQEYYKAASEGRAPNLARAIASAIRYRGMDKGNEELMKNLDKSARIIAEKA